MKKLILILVAALLLRLALLFLWYQTGQGARLSADAIMYHQIAESLVQGEGFRLEGQPTSRRPPFYPFFMSILLKYLPFPLGVQIAQAVLGALSCIILYGLGKEMFDPKVGLVAAGIFAVDYLSVRQAISVMSEVVFVFWLLGSLYFLFWAKKRETKVGYLAAGICAGFSLLTKDFLAFYVPFVGGWLFSLPPGPKKVRIKRTLIFLLGLILIVGPWVVRNGLVNRHFVLISAYAGHNIYFGNNEQTIARIDGGQWEFGRDVILPEDPQAPPLGTVEADRYFFDKGIHYISSNPARFFGLMGRKIVKMWRPYGTDWPRISQWIVSICYLPVLILGLLGAVRSRDRWREFLPVYLLLLYLVLAPAVTVSEIRYRYPAMPFLMIFAAYSLNEIWRKTERIPYETMARN
jgi:4-amino-4-deoxy-L-arabinose transferase-like glycosyltransferase